MTTLSDLCFKYQSQPLPSNIWDIMEAAPCAMRDRFYGLVERYLQVGGLGPWNNDTDPEDADWAEVEIILAELKTIHDEMEEIIQKARQIQ